MSKKNLAESQESSLGSCVECQIGKAEIMWQKRLVIDYDQPLEDLIATLPRNIRVENELLNYRTDQKGIMEVNLVLAKIKLNSHLAHHIWEPTYKEAVIIISENPLSEAGEYEMIYFSKYLSEIPFRNFRVLASRDKVIRAHHLAFAPMLVRYERNTARVADVCLDDISHRGDNLYFLLVEKQENK